MDRSQEEKVVRKIGKCPICGGRTTMKRVSVTESAGKRLVLIKKVEAEVCSQCGERMYSENTAETRFIDAKGEGKVGQAGSENAGRSICPESLVLHRTIVRIKSRFQEKRRTDLGFNPKPRRFSLDRRWKDKL